MNYPDVLAHDMPKQLTDRLFVVHGSVSMLPIVKLTRNMAIVRHDGKLTLINPVRMSEAGLAALEALGEVSHVLRLGPFHGMDDGFYVDRYKVPFWSFPGGTTYTKPAITNVLKEGGPLPMPNASLLTFGHIKEPEGVLLFEDTPGVLITCDAIQTYSTPPHMPHTAWLTRLLMPLVGFPNETIIGPFWVKLLVEDKEAIKADFERVLALPFDQLLAAHGTFLASDARTEVQRAFDKMFG